MNVLHAVNYHSSDKNMFTEYNNMEPCLLLLPNNIKSMLENLTMVEEMLT